MVLDKSPTSFFYMGISVLFLFLFFEKTVLSQFNGLGSTIRDYHNKEDGSCTGNRRFNVGKKLRETAE